MPDKFVAPLTNHKNILLRRLTGSTKNQRKYKRFLGSPLRYAGGKSLAVGFILELLPDKVQRIISPFLGGASFEIACATRARIPVIGFDIFDLLINYWQIQIQHPQKLTQRLSDFQPTKDTFKEIKRRLKNHWEQKEIIRDKIDLAAYYYFNHNTSYGPGFLSWPSSVYMQENRYKTMINKVKNTILNNFEVHCDSFENVFPKYENDFFYCDPPYYLGNDSKMFKGIYPQRNFPIHHNHFPHETLRDLLHRHKGKFILSYNDCPTIREWYKDFECIEVAWQYTMGQGETRIGVNRKEQRINHTKKSHELLIVKR